MPSRVGIDLVAIDDVKRSLERHGQRYVERLYTAHEIESCHAAGELSASRLAARFAAKEATLKVLRPEDEAIPWHAIEVVSSPDGEVGLQLSGRAAEKAGEADLVSLRLSLTRDAGFASALVVANCAPRREVDE